MHGLVRPFAVSVTAAVIAAAAFVVASDDGPGPIPECNGETATHVLVAETPDTQPATIAAAIAPYQEWIDAGVDVQANENAFLRGSEGHDSMVSLVSTNAGGFVGNPGHVSNRTPPTAGDFMCSYLTNSDDLYYGSQRGDFVFDAGGGDDYYLGGCKLDGEGSPGDRQCDRMVDVGPPGKAVEEFSPDADSTWTFIVPKGRRTVLIETEGRENEAWNHNYVGRGPGKVYIDGGGCSLNIDGQLVSCVGRVLHDGDHVHPCPVEKTEIDVGLEVKKFAGITTVGIEYFGPEPTVTANDPCAFQQSSF